ncbi:helix-turn-helix domain-containing protein [Saccharospirillum impatiens]|uniref:helix-turn-helix domain-containing protein n=1 Tax=Saccharospirillum impatiens TaxID=169438 RepID=UPI00040E1585|nr:helix-turn-helix transcriptional regulator [Saccharospirillum impatiens]
MTFSDRLKVLIAGRTVSDFARSVGLGESLIRKYLAGSEPSLSRAHQIARSCQCSLAWLASGEGLPFDAAPEVALDALQSALRIIAREPGRSDVNIPDTETLKHIIALYQYLRHHRLRDGTVDELLGQSFMRLLQQGEAPNREQS